MKAVLDINQKSKNISENTLFPSRRNIRVKVMKACYAFFMSEASSEEVFERLLKEVYHELKRTSNSEKKYKDEEANIDEFLVNLYYGTIKNEKYYKQLLAPIIKNWDVQRVSVVDRIILLMAVHEIFEIKGIHIKVTINEYIDISKRYGTDKSSVFINGVLDAFVEANAKDIEETKLKGL